MAARDISSPQHDANGTRLMVHARRVDDVRMSGMVAFKRLLRRTFCVRLGSQAAIERPLLAPLLVSPKYEIQRSKSVE